MRTLAAFTGRWLLAVAAGALLPGWGSTGAAAAANAGAVALERMLPFLEQHCISCHDDRLERGGLDLTSLAADMTDIAALSVWERVHDRVEAGEMPPENRPRPAADERDEFIAGLAEEMEAGHGSIKATVLRRLNRLEYEHTVNDLLGTRLELAGLLPEDGRGDLFDTVADALDLSPVHLARYMDAAQLALETATRRVTEPERRVTRHQLGEGNDERNIGRSWQRRERDGAVVAFLNDDTYPGLLTRSFSAPFPGRYLVTLRVDAYRSERPIQVSVYSAQWAAGGLRRTRHGTFDVQTGEGSVIEVEVPLERGQFLQLMPHGLPNSWGDVYRRGDNGESTAADFQGPGLAIQGIEVEGPLIDEWPGRGHRLLFGDLEAANPIPPERVLHTDPERQPVTSEQPHEDLRRLLPGFIEAAFRRPVEDGDVAFFVELAEAEMEQGASFEQAIRTAQVAVLCSPEFLFFHEPDPGPLDSWAVASRLSYFLHRSLPDQELLAAAGEGRLADADGLRAQLERLLADPRSARFVEDFTGQWLNLRAIDDTTPDARLYPEFDDRLQHAMVDETTLFFDEVLRNNLSVVEFIDSDWTYVNERLAAHYRIEGVEGGSMRRVELRPEDRRGGVMTHASVLKVSANGATTSPVLRGIWVLERMLGVHPSPPPPGVPGVEPDIRGAETLRELLVKHRDSTSCRSCHQLIDPPGFALEHYDVIGGWRENYRSLGDDFPRPPEELTNGRNVQWRIGPGVDASGETRDGHEFSDWQDFKRLILDDADRFAGAFTAKLATFASGREMGFSDRREIAAIIDRTRANGHRFRDILDELVASPLFLHK